MASSPSSRGRYLFSRAAPSLRRPSYPHRHLHESLTSLHEGGVHPAFLDDYQPSPRSRSTRRGPRPPSARGRPRVQLAAHLVPVDRRHALVRSKSGFTHDPIPTCLPTCSLPRAREQAVRPAACTPLDVRPALPRPDVVQLKLLRRRLATTPSATPSLDRATTVSAHRLGSPPRLTASTPSSISALVGLPSWSAW